MKMASGASGLNLIALAAALLLGIGTVAAHVREDPEAFTGGIIA